MKKHLIYLCACVCAMFWSCTPQNTPDNKADNSYYECDVFVEPYLEWGTKSDDVQKWMTDHGFAKSKETYINDQLVKYYAGRKKEIETAQLFNKTTLAYESAMIYFQSGNYNSWVELTTALSDRYTFIRDNGEAKEYNSKDGKTFIQLITTTANGVTYDVVIYSAR